MMKSPVNSMHQARIHWSTREYERQKLVYELRRNQPNDGILFSEYDTEKQAMDAKRL